MGYEDVQAAAKECGQIQAQMPLQADHLSSHCSSVLEAPTQQSGTIGEDKVSQDLGLIGMSTIAHQVPPNVNIEASHHSLAASAIAEYQERIDSQKVDIGVI